MNAHVVAILTLIAVIIMEVIPLKNKNIVQNVEQKWTCKRKGQHLLTGAALFFVIPLAF